MIIGLREKILKSDLFQFYGTFKTLKKLRKDITQKALRRTYLHKD